VGFVTALNAQVMLRTNNGINYVVAAGGGGGGVRADLTAASPGRGRSLASRPCQEDR